MAITQLPAVQNILVKSVTSILGEKLNYPIEISKVSIGWVNEIVLHDVVIKDRKRNEMIRIDKIVASFRLPSLIKKDIQIDKAVLKHAVVKLYFDTEVDDVNLSHFIFSITHMGADTSQVVPPNPPGYTYAAFKIRDVVFEDASCTFDDPRFVKKTDRFDWAHFEFNHIAINASDFSIVRDTVRAHIVNLDAKDKFSGIEIKDMNTKFGICENFIRLEELTTYLGDSYITNNVVMDFNKFGNMSYIEDSVRMKLNFKNTIIYSKDIAVFQPELHGFNDVWRVSGDFKGIVRDFVASNLSLSFGKSSIIHVNHKAKFKGLPDWDHTSMDIDVKYAEVTSSDLKKYGLKDAGDQLDKFKSANLVGSFKGYTDAFAVKAILNTEIGKLDADFELSIPKKDFPGSYKAVIKTEDLDIGLVFDEKKLQKMTSEFRIEGEGFNRQQAKFTLQSRIDKLGLNGYDYQKINADGRMANEYFHGSLDVKDPNMDIDLIGNVNFRKGSSLVGIDAHLRKTNLFKTNFYNKKLEFSSNIKIKTNGWDLENLNGSLECNGINLKDSTNNLFIDGFDVYYDNVDKKERNFKIKSELVDMNIDGNFELKRFAGSVTEMVEDLKVNWRNNDTLLTTFFKQKKIDRRLDQSFNYHINFKNINPLCKIFLPEVYISSNSKVAGKFSSDESNSFTIAASPDTFGFGGTKLVQSHFLMKIVKAKGNTDVVADVKLNSKYLLVDNNTSAENLVLNTSWAEKIIDFDFALKQYIETNEVKLGGRISFLENIKRLKFIDSHFKLLDKEWVLDENNAILFRSDRAEFNNVEIANEEQKISISGVISPDEGKSATLKIEKFNLSNFNKLLGINVGGELNAYMMIKDIFKDPRIYSQLWVNNLKIKKLAVGEVKGVSNWDNTNKRLVLNLDIERNGTRIFDLQGYYQPKSLDPTKHLKMNLLLNKTNMVVFEPFLGSVLSELKGEASGKIDIQGSLTKPLLNGQTEIQNGSLKINYLNTVYNFTDEKITFMPDRILLQNIVLNDVHNNLLVIDGGIYHTNYNNLKMNIGGHFSKVQILNTTRTDSSMYYGKAIASGDFNVNGTFDNFKIKVDAIAMKGTNISIQLKDANTVEKKEFISFVKKGKISDKTLKNRLLKINQDNFKIEMDFKFELTPDAYMEVIIDPIAGDKISGYGNGKINMQINTDGNFSIFGDYEFIKDSYYNFSYVNAINKDFTIRRGSRVSFNGDPYEGQIDVVASYDDRVSLHPLVDTSYWNVPGIKLPYPVSTLIYLKGDILKPMIKYDIQIKDYPAAIGRVPLFSYVTAFENKIRNNENEMANQVFGLLALRRFFSTGVGLENAIGGTVSELVSNQLSNLFSKVDPNLSLDLNLNGLNRDALNAMQVRVSYNLLSGRIRISRSTGNTQNQNATANVIGEWTVEYMLTNDGKFRLKGFNKNNPNSLSASQTAAGNPAAGFSIMHTSSFNSLNPFEKKKKKQLLEKDKK